MEAVFALLVVESLSKLRSLMKPVISKLMNQFPTKVYRLKRLILKTNSRLYLPI